MDDLFTEVVVKKNRTTAEAVLKTLPVYLTILILALGIFIQPFLLALLLIPLLMKVFLSPRLDVEYEYSYVSGELDIAKIFSKQSRKQIASYNMKEMELLAPLSSSHMDGFRGNPNIKKADYSSGKPENSDKVYAFIISVNSQKQMVLFEPGEKILQDLRTRMPGKVCLQ